MANQGVTDFINIIKGAGAAPMTNPMALGEMGRTFGASDPISTLDRGMLKTIPDTESPIRQWTEGPDQRPPPSLRQISEFAKSETGPLLKGSISDKERAQMLKQLERLGEIGSAPMAESAQELAFAGEGPDTQLVHAEVGDVLIPPAMLEDDPDLESTLQRKFEEYDVDPDSRVVGVGIASLNKNTGLEEFGFFKKLVKGIKKVIRPIVKVAQFIPGPWQPIAALASRALTVYDVAKGRANPLSLLTVAGPLATGPSIGKSIGGIKSLGNGSFLRGIGQSFTQTPGALRSGIGSLFQDPRGSIQSVLGQIFGAGGSTPPIMDQGQLGSVDDILSDARATGDWQTETRIERMRSEGASDDAILQNLYGAGMGQPAQQGGNWLQQLLSGGTQGQSGIGRIEDILKGRSSDPVRAGGGLRGLLGGQGGGGGLGSLLGGSGGLGGLAAAGIPAYFLAKMAADEARNQRGVPLTPLTTMGPTGRYNIEAEIARRMGNAPPNPVEFGLLPEGTLPQLSGGSPLSNEGGDPRLDAVISRYYQDQLPVEDSQNEWLGDELPGGYMGGPVMAYADGGNVSTEEFERMNGDIDGPGTETSDDVPAMLSDGEFVMTGRAVRGAGAFNLNNRGGIITLTPNGEEDRDKGTSLMYDMMELFGNYANAN